MKKQIVTICLITIAFTGFSQNKKEQIEELNLRIDSCKTVISNQSSDLNSKQIKISELDQKIDSCKTVISNQSSDLNSKQIKISELDQKIVEEQKNSLEKSKQITLLNKEIESLKSKIPAEVSFKFKVINQAENQDARFGTDSETELYLMIQNQLVDTYSEFGDPQLDSNKTQVYLTSEMSEKSYNIVSISSSKVLVQRHFFCSDCEIQESEMEKVYQKDVSGIWKFQSCSGDCEDE